MANSMYQVQRGQRRYKDIRESVKIENFEPYEETVEENETYEPVEEPELSDEELLSDVEFADDEELDR